MGTEISILKININTILTIKIDQEKGATPSCGIAPFRILLSSRRASLLC